MPVVNLDQLGKTPVKLARVTLRPTLVAIFLLLPGCGGGGNGGPTPPDGGDPPSLNLGSVDLQVDEDQEYTADVSGVVTNGTLQSVTVTDGSNLVAVELDGGTLHVTPAPDQHGNFTLEFTASNSDGTASRVKAGTVEPWTDIAAGQLQDNETDTGVQGEIRLYNPSSSSPIKTIQTDADGNYEGVQNLSSGHVILQARAMQNGEPQSYIRTIRSQGAGADLEVDLLRVVPFDGLAENGISVEDFRSHVLDLRRHDNHEITKWDVDNFEGVYIIQTNPEADDNSTFTQTEQENIRDKWADPSGAPRLIEGHIPDTVVIGAADDEDPPFHLTDDNGKVQPNLGWVIIKPDSTMPAAGAADPDDLDNDGKYETGEISVRTEGFENTGAITVHEGVHMFYNWIHPETLPPDKTIAAAVFKTTVPQLADEKSGYIYQETTYKLGESVRDVVGLDWLDGS